MHSQRKREPALEEESMLLPINVFLEYMCIFYQKRELQAYLVCKEELSMQFLKEMLLLKEESSVAPQGLH